MAAGRDTLLGLIVVIVAFAIAAYNSISLTNFAILDTDPSTYVVVVMLMMFLFLVFYAKRDIALEIRARNLAIAAALYAVYIVALSVLRVATSFLFLSYRIDALLFPLLLMPMLIAVFGPKAVKEFRAVLIYSLFASPIILMPVLLGNSAFTQLNADFVYSVMKAVGAPVVQNGVTISAPASSISIASTCADIGAFVAFVMFLIPIAWLYEGKIRAKAGWIAGGILLLLLLNFLRMTSIALVWAYSGIGSAVSTFHLFAGQVIFYAAIIIMLVLAGRFGLGIARIQRGFAEGLAKSSEILLENPVASASVAVVIVMGLFAFFMSIPYASSVYRPAVLLDHNSSANWQQSLYGDMVSSLNATGANVLHLQDLSQASAFALTGNSSTTAEQAIFVLINDSAMPFIGGFQANQSDMVSNVYAYVLNDGVRLDSGILASKNETFRINYFSLPYNTSNGWRSLNYEVFARINSTYAKDCLYSASFGFQDRLESAIYNIMSPGGSAAMCTSYKIAGA
ncbi:MAG: exosortase/archaeosortase family protein [Candidatus Micrarchaeota archaeon]|nr:exosortase/archaeosortase family protein [Candidatus Micrarchaeota archaeon]